ncbi:MAG: potassium transporter TrkG, partial [Chloroflexota bacterium]
MSNEENGRDYPRQRVRQAVRGLIQDSERVARKPRPVALRLVVGLFILVIVGTLLLQLPGMTYGERLSFMEALFTATSAVTVTGLTVITASTDLTRSGQIVLLFLVQVGGV